VGELPAVVGLEVRQQLEPAALVAPAIESAERHDALRPVTAAERARHQVRQIHGELSRRRGIVARLPSRAAAQNPRRNENAAAASCLARPRRDRRVQPKRARARRHGERRAFGRGWPGQAWPFSPDRHGSVICGAYLPLHSLDALTVRQPGASGQPGRRVACREQDIRARPRCSPPGVALDADPLLADLFRDARLVGAGVLDDPHAFRGHDPLLDPLESAEGVCGLAGVLLWTRAPRDSLDPLDAGDPVQTPRCSCLAAPAAGKSRPCHPMRRWT
jgi:hypothetical protein